MNVSKIKKFNSRLEYILKANNKARKYCDWGDIDDMAALVDNIELSDNIDQDMNLYRNTCAFILGFRQELPLEVQEKPAMVANAQDAILEWCLLKGFIEKWQESQS